MGFGIYASWAEKGKLADVQWRAAIWKQTKTEMSELHDLEPTTLSIGLGT